MDFVDLTDKVNQVGRLTHPVQGLVFHHTSGAQRPDGSIALPTPTGVVNTFNQRGFPAHYVMDRDGTVYQTIPDGGKGQHMRNASQYPNAANRSLNNGNTIGIEVIAKDNKDWTPAQVKASQQFAAQMQQKYPGIGNNIYGHGELNPGHKQADEGMAAVTPFRAVSGAPGTAPNTMAIAKALQSDPTTAQAAATGKPAAFTPAPELTSITLPGKGSYALEDGVLSPTTTGKTDQKLASAGDMVANNPTLPGQAPGFNGANQNPGSNGFSGTSGQIQQPQGVLGQLASGHLGGILGQLQSGQLGGLAGKIGNMLVSPAAAADGVKPLASAGALASNQPISGVNAPSTSMVTMPDGSQMPYTSSGGPESSIPQGAPFQPPAPTPAPSPAPSTPFIPPAPTPGATTPSMTMPGSPAAPASVGQPMTGQQAIDNLFGAPSTPGAGQPMTGQQAIDNLFGAPSTPGTGQPLTAPQAVSAATGGDQPLVISGIRPSSQQAQPANPFQAPLVQADTTPTKVRPDGWNGFTPRTDAPDPHGPLGSQVSIFGSNYHGPDSGLLNQAMGAPTPNYNQQYFWQNNQPVAGPQSPAGNFDPLTGQNLAQPPQQTAGGMGGMGGMGQGLGQFDPLTGQMLNNNSGSGFMSFIGGLFG